MDRQNTPEGVPSYSEPNLQTLRDAARILGITVDELPDALRQKDRSSSLRSWMVRGQTQTTMW
jgi:hypothetical protein